MRTNTKSIVAAAGMAAGLALAGAAQAQTPYVINLSGATLLQTQINNAALYRDFLDVDGDGFSGGLIANLDQLAPTYATASATLPTRSATQNGAWWFVSYRATGSVNGFQELVDFGFPQPYNVGDGTATAGNIQVLLAADGAWFNRTQFVTNGGCTTGSALFNLNNPGGLPIRSSTPAAGTAPFAQISPSAATSCGAPGGAAPGGLRIDIAPVDVPSSWATRNAGPADPADAPAQPGYGTNPRVSVNRNGTSTGAGIDNLLAGLGSRTLFDPANPGAATNSTIFDSLLCFAPVALLSNIGVGIQTLDQSDVRHLYATGRRLNGENLVAVTRDSGSGTRNAFNNPTGLDPSFGVGENVGGTPGSPSGVGGVAADQPANRLGSQFEPSNKGGSGILEVVVLNHRLAVGNTGAPRTVGFLTAQNAEVIGIRHDLSAIAQGVPVASVLPSRPTLNNIVNNDLATNPAAYFIGGPAIFAHVGDPRSSLNVGVAGTDAANTNPPMSNPEAAKLINNITRSIDAFVSFPGAGNDFMPGEAIAQGQVLLPTQRKIQGVNQPLSAVNNPLFNAAAQAAVLALPPAQAALNNAAMVNYNAAANGRVPNRVLSVTYTDGNTGANYRLNDGTTVNYNTANGVPVRNKLCGDFNGDGLRNANDAVELVRAYRSRISGPNFAAWNAPDGIYGALSGAKASPELLGDFDGDGNFNLADLRYWADGLAINPSTGKLDRKLGFEALDNAWQAEVGNNNLFGTTGLSTWVVGASRFDLSGAPGIARGWAPVGANGVIDATDRGYIVAQIAAAGGNGDWTDVAQAVKFDLSADVTGDLKVDAADLAAYDALFGTVTCYADCDSSGGLSPADFTCFLGKFRAGTLPYADCDLSGGLSPADFTCFLGKFRAGCP